MDKRVLFIGGSPCSGKSTVAEYISDKYGAHYFKVDDFLDKYIDLAAKKGYPVCKRYLNMTPEEVWMREPLLQCDEEYERLSKLDVKFPAGGPITYPFGIRNFYVSDPEGNLLEIGSDNLG